MFNWNISTKVTINVLNVNATMMVGYGNILNAGADLTFNNLNYSNNAS